VKKNKAKTARDLKIKSHFFTVTTDGIKSKL
jgi:hypothetical protein